MTPNDQRSGSTGEPDREPEQEGCDVSQHSQRTQTGPSRAQVAAVAALTAASALVTGYAADGPWNEDQVVATVLGAALTALLLARVLGLMTERAVVADRAAREAERAQERERQEWRIKEAARERNTGVWTGPEGQRLSVRWDPDERRYYVEGWLSEDWKVPFEVPWHDSEMVASTLEGLERDSRMVPADTEGTRALRARLMLADWGQPIEPGLEPEYAEPPEEPYLQPDPGEGPVVYPQPSPDDTRTWLADPEVSARYQADPVGHVVDQAVTGYLDEELDPAGRHHAEPSYVRPAMPRWNAFETSGQRRPELTRVAVPLPPRGEYVDGYVDPGPYSSFVPVSPGRVDPDGYMAQSLVTDYQIDCDGTCGDHGCPAFADRMDPDATKVMGRIDPDATEVIARVR